MRIAALFVLSVLFFATASTVHAADGIIDAAHSYTWGDKLGWINFAATNGNVSVTDSALSGYIWSSAYGWINLAPAHGGVTNNGGVLGGKAWGENTGWIDFNGITINSSTGKFSGTTISEAVGTLTFDCANCDVRTDWRPASAGGSVGAGGSGATGKSGGSGSSAGPTQITMNTSVSPTRTATTPDSSVKSSTGTKSVLQNPNTYTTGPVKTATSTSTRVRQLQRTPITTVRAVTFVILLGAFGTLLWIVWKWIGMIRVR